MWGVLRSVCPSLSRILIFFPFRPHPVPREPAKGSPGPLKTNFFQTNYKLACGVSPKVSAQACQNFLRFFFHFDLTRPPGPLQRVPKASKTEFLKQAKGGMRGIPRSVSSPLVFHSSQFQDVVSFSYLIVFSWVSSNSSGVVINP